MAFEPAGARVLSAFGRGSWYALLADSVADDLTLDSAMDRYAQGEDAAFAVVHAGLHAKLWMFLMRLTAEAALADDLVQETFLRMHRARGGFQRGAAVVPWAYAIARNAWLDHVRSAKVRRQRERPGRGDGDDAPDPPTGPDADAEQVVIARETAELVERTLAALPEAQREAFVLLRYEGMSVEEAADVVGSTPSAVKLRAFRAYEALREVLGRARVARGGSRAG
jgi:RNA polymerase sigma-70 factor (ECF subfamily)